MAMDQVDRIGRDGLGDGAREVDAGLTQQVRAEFLEMPGLTLTFRQAMRLWNLEAAACRAVLDLLLRAGFLTETRTGAYRRLEG
jgi:hypothetical protein